MQLNVKVVPRSSRTEIAGVLADGTLRVRVAAAPDKGRANDALCEFLAQHYGVPRSSVTVVGGHTSTRKIVRFATR